MKSLVILAHPNIDESRVNKRWKEELDKYPEEIEIHELYKEYPDWKIDVEREQRLLETHDHIILQFPFYSYSYPALLKKWMDDVFTYGWAYGSKGDKLQGKKFGTAISVGGKEEGYLKGGSVTYTLDELLAPFKACMLFIGAVTLPCFTLFGASFEAGDEDVNRSARDYIDYITAHK